MHRETGYKKITEDLHSNGHLPEYLLVTLGKNKPKVTRGNMKEIISKSYKVQMFPSVSQRIFKKLLQHLFKFKKRLC